MFILLPLRDGRFNVSFRVYALDDSNPCPVYAISYGRHYEVYSENGYTNHKGKYWVCHKKILLSRPVISWPYRWFVSDSHHYDQLHFLENGEPDPKYMKYPPIQDSRPIEPPTVES